MEQRHRQQRARLHGRRRRHDAGDLLADEAVQLPGHQRADDVAVAAEHALGVAGGARGVEDGGRVIGLDVDGRHRHVAGGSHQIGQVAHAGSQRLAGPHRQHLQAGQVAAGRHAVQPLLVGDQHLGAAVLQAVGHLVGLPVGVHRHRHCADGGGGIEGQHPLGVVAHRDRHPIAGPHAAVMHQHMADARRGRPGLGEAEVFVQVGDAGQVAGGAVEQRPQRGWRVGEGAQPAAVDHLLAQFIGLAGGGQFGDGLNADGVHAQRPLKTGSRFSTKALVASRWSSVWPQWMWWVASRSRQSSTSPAIARLRFSFM